MSKKQVFALVDLLHDAQKKATEQILEVARFENLGDTVPDSDFTVRDVLQMWIWHFWSHHRELILARGSLKDDNPHFHVPHFIRQANEEFGKFIGELACLSDEQLDLRPPNGDRTVREIVEHVLYTLTDYFANQITQSHKQE